MTTATLSSKHQITIPKAIRQQMNLHEGDRIEFQPNAAGEIVLQKNRQSPKSDGAAAQFIKPGKRLSVAEIKAAAKVGAQKSFSR
jgi:antitoxin PrlF